MGEQISLFFIYTGKGMPHLSSKMDKNRDFLKMLKIFEIIKNPIFKFLSPFYRKIEIFLYVLHMFHVKQARLLVEFHVKRETP